MNADVLLAALRRINVICATLVGVALLACVAFILLDIALRPLGMSFGGTDEVSGYVMAGATSWGLSYALIALAHVRIDLLRARCDRPFRLILDFLSLGLLAAVAILVALQGWGVFSSTLANDARANTALETPLWIPQLAWWGGWVWFAVCALLLWAAALAAVLSGHARAAEAAIGVEGDAS